MAIVHFGLEQQRFTGGLTEVEVEAPNVKQLIAKLEARFPGIGPILESSAVAINGEVVNDAAYEAVPPGAEIYFVVKAAGGSADQASRSVIRRSCSRSRRSISA